MLPRSTVRAAEQRLVINPLMHIRDFLKSIPYIAWALIFAALTWGVFGTFIGQLAPLMRTDMQLSGELIGRLMAFATLGSALGALCGGEVAKRFDARNLLLGYVGGMLVMLVLICLARDYTLLTLCFFGIALFETAMFTLGHGLLANLSSHAEHRTRIIALVDVGWSLGTVLGPLWVSLVFLAGASWRNPYIAFVLVVVLLLLVMWPRSAYAGRHLHLSMTQTPPPPSASPTQEAATTSSVATAATSRTTALAGAAINSYPALFRLPVVRWVLLSAVCIGFVEWAQYFWFVSYASEGLGVNYDLARRALIGFLAGMLIGRCWQAFVHSRWRMEQKLYGTAWLTLLGQVLLCLPGLWLSVRADASTSVAWLLLCNLLVGLGVSVAFPILLGMALREAPAQAPRLSALLMTAIIAGTLLAGYVIGLLSDFTDIRKSYFIVLPWAALYVVCVVKMNRLVHVEAEVSSPVTVKVA